MLERCLLTESAIKRLVEPEEVGVAGGLARVAECGHGDRRVLHDGRRLDCPLTCAEPRTHPAQRLGDVGRRPRERQAHVGAAVHGVEVDTRRDRNTGVGQQLCAECRVSPLSSRRCRRRRRTRRRRAPAGPARSAAARRSSNSRLTAYCSTSASASAIDSGANAATAAFCGRVGGQMEKFPVRQSTARSSGRGTSSQPSRQPVIAKYFEKLFTTIASREVSHAQLVCGAPGYTRPW